MAQPKRKHSPWRDIDITDDDINVIQARRIPREIKARRDDIRYTVRMGDTIFRLATRFYGDPLLWKYIMDRNKMDYPLDMSPGDIIIVPSVITVQMEARRL